MSEEFKRQLKKAKAIVVKKVVEEEDDTAPTVVKSKSKGK